MANIQNLAFSIPPVLGDGKSANEAEELICSSRYEAPFGRGNLLLLLPQLFNLQTQFNFERKINRILLSANFEQF